jgi:hypothetical protein
MRSCPGVWSVEQQQPALYSEERESLSASVLQKFTFSRVQRNVAGVKQLVANQAADGGMQLPSLPQAVRA